MFYSHLTKVILEFFYSSIVVKTFFFLWKSEGVINFSTLWSYVR